MRHLFIINPIAARVKGKVRDLISEIDAFFRELGMSNYEIYVTNWARDGMGYANEFALASLAAAPGETVRVHVIGGSGTMFEAVNGTIGLPNAQIAAYPMGGSNFFIHYFGTEKEHLFRSLENQVFSGVTPIDAMRYDNNYGIGYAIIGLEAVSDRDGSEMRERMEYLPVDFCYLYTAVKAIMRSSRICQHYEVDIDGKDYSGEYLSMLVAGVPGYGRDMTPALEAHPNDGLMDVYLMKKMSRLQLLRGMNTYVSGGYEKLDWGFVHERCKKIAVSAERDIIMSLDDEKFYDRSVSYEVVPGAVSFVCPDIIDVKKLPRVYKKADK